MDTFFKFTEWLLNYLELVENVKLINNTPFSKQYKECSLSPERSQGSPVDDSTARPTVCLTLDTNKSEAKIKWLYLNNVRRGIGSEIVNKLIEFCTVNDINTVVLAAVDKKNIESQKFCESFDIDKRIEYTECFYYYKYLG